MSTRTTESTLANFAQPSLKRSESLGCAECRFGFASTATASESIPTWGFMVGQQYECQDCQERMVVPLEFDTEEAYQAFRKEMLGDSDRSEE